VPLVPEPAEESGAAAEFIPLVEVTDVGAFALVTAQLEVEGIPWYIQSEPPLGLPSEPGDPVTVIYVVENCLDQARRVVETVSLIGVDYQL
jgi:hypothetical protein